MVCEVNNDPNWGGVKRGLCRAMSSQMAKPAFHPPVCCTFRCDWIWNDLLALVCAHAVGLAAFAARARRWRVGAMLMALWGSQIVSGLPKQNHSANPAARCLPGFHRPRLTLSGALNSDANLNARLQKPGSSQTRKADRASPQRDEQRHHALGIMSGDYCFLHIRAELVSSSRNLLIEPYRACPISGP